MREKERRHDQENEQKDKWIVDRWEISLLVQGCIRLSLDIITLLLAALVAASFK